MTYDLTSEERERVISFLRLPKPLARILRDMDNLKCKLNFLAEPGLSPSRIYQQLHSHSLPAIQAMRIASDSLPTRQNIDLFLKKLRYVKCILTGNDLQNMGITPGPRMKEILQSLHEAKLDGRVKNREDEEKMVREWRERGNLTRR
jgi:tRNA nucleotidyltransferase (CCA-adding enzyme)